MRHFNWRRWFQAGLAAIVLASPPPSEAATRLTVSSWAPHGHLLREALVAWCEELSLRSRGRVGCDLLDQPISTLHEQLEAVERAAVDIAVAIHSLDPQRFVLTRLAELPLAGTTTEQSSVAFYQLWNKHLRRYREHKGLHVLTVFTQAPGQLFTTGRAVAQADDLSGLSLRTGGGIARQVLGSLSGLGVREVFVPIAASLHAVEDHQLDGMLVTAENVFRYGLQNTLKYQWELPGGLYRHSFSLVINEQVWKRLTRSERAVIAEVSGEAAARIFGRAADQYEANLQMRLAAQGVMVTQATPAQVKRLARRIRVVEQAWVTAARERGLSNAAKILAEHRRRLAP